MYLLKLLYIIQIVLQKHASTFFLLMLMLRAIRAVENAGKSGMKFSYSNTFLDHEQLANYDNVNIFLIPALFIRYQGHHISNIFFYFSIQTLMLIDPRNIPAANNFMYLLYKHILQMYSLKNSIFVLRFTLSSQLKVLVSQIV